MCTGYYRSIKEKVVIFTQQSLGNVEDIMFELNVGLYRGFPKRLERIRKTPVHEVALCGGSSLVWTNNKE